MSSFNLGLPTDIPWKRKCFTDDMVHSPICGAKPPNPWIPSIIVYEYTPEDDYQPLLAKHGQKVSYLKVTVSITPDAPEIPSVYLANFLPKSYAQAIRKAQSCYGALLQISLGPAGSGTARDLYFADFEPKKRELFEAVTSTGQIASGSQNSVAVGKSAVNSESTETFSSFNAGVNFGISLPLIGEAKVGASGTSSSTNRAGSERSEVTNIDRSTERRELSSHTTQLSQLYNLFQSFHVGTNRAVFFMEPRPHVLQSQATFINGPRALEGIQDIFLVVVCPENMEDFCVGVHLQTAHLDTDARFVDDIEENTVLVSHQIQAEQRSGAPDGATGYTASSFVYEPPDGWIVDVDKTSEEGINVIEDKPGWPAFPSKTSVESVSTARVILKGEVSWQVYNTGVNKGTLKFNFLVHIKKKERSIRESLKSMYINTRNLCCCHSRGGGNGAGSSSGGGGDTPMDCDKDYDYDPGTLVNNTHRVVTWPGMNLERDLGQRDIVSGPATEQAIYQSNELTAVVRREILKALTTTDDEQKCAVPFVKSDVFYSQVAGALETYDLSSEIGKPVNRSSAVPFAYRDAISRRLGNITLGSFLRTDMWELSDALGRPIQEILATKEQILRTIAPHPSVPVQSLRTIIGVRIGSTYPDPGTVRVLVDMSNPAAIPQVQHSHKPNVIDIIFSDTPDGESITGSAITITQGSNSVAKQIVRVGSNIVRLIITDPLQAGALYTVTVNGTTSPPITFGGALLDGDPLAFPSGDGVEGGDFRFAIRVVGAPSTTIPSVTPLANVVGVLVASSSPDPGNPRVLHSMDDPRTVQVVNYHDQPNIIKVLFSEQPDSGTVTAQTFRVTQNGQPVNATVALGSNATATLTITDTIQPNALYTITLKGEGENRLTFQGKPLDGEPLGFPSGNAMEGGDFVCMMKPYQPVTLPPPPIPDPMLNVVGVRFMSSASDANNPRVLAEMIHPSVAQIVYESDEPDIIEISFSHQPDSGSLTHGSFVVMDGSNAVGVSLISSSGTAARFKLSSSLEGGREYQCTLFGSGTNAPTYQTKVLDGEPSGLPSGDGVAGGDFAFNLRVERASTVQSPGIISTLRVTAVRVRSNYQNPNIPIVLTQMSHPIEILAVSAASYPNIIEVVFNKAPDNGTLTTSTFTIQAGTGIVPGAVVMKNDTTAWFVPQGPLTADDYLVTLVGSGTGSQITHNNQPLDGEPYSFPSGDGTHGGDFTAEIKVYSGISV